MIRLLTLITLLIVGQCYLQENNVLQLTDSDFEQAVQQYPNLFVKFYTPWCHHCKKLAPIYSELAGQLQQEHAQFKLAKIDLQSNNKTQQKYRVQSYPTLMYFKQANPINFKGSRSKDFMKFWLLKKSQDTIIALDQSRLSELQSDGNVNIVFYGDLNTPQGAILLVIAKTDDYNIYYVVETKSKPMNSVEIFRPFGPVLRNEVVTPAIRNWISLHDRPLVFQYNDRTSSELFSQKRNGVLLFISPGEHRETVINAFKEAAEQWKVTLKKKLIFTSMSLEDEDTPQFLDYVKVDAIVHPLMFVKNAEKFKYLYTGKIVEITSAKIIDFLKLVQAGKVKKLKMDDESRPQAPKDVSTTPTSTEL